MSDVVVYQEPKPLTLTDVKGQVNLIQEIMRGVMKVNEHYGVIPGTGTKPTLLKPGAEKLCLTFRLAPTYAIEQLKDGDHLTVLSTCTLTHIPSGQVYGAGMGSCSTREGKYAYRSASRKCPECGKEAIIKGKEEYGGGWVCFKKKDGCGAKFDDNDEAITSQAAGKIPNDNLPDTYNTVLKMSNKRALVAAVLNVTAASDIFTQDIEDMTDHSPAPAAPTPAASSSATGAPSSGLAAGESLPPGGWHEPRNKVSLEQAMNLAAALGECDTDAEKAFLAIAKLKSLQDLPAADYDEAMDWAARRKKRRPSK